MAETVHYGSAAFKDQQGNTVTVRGWTEGDVNKVQDIKTRLAAAEQAIKVINSGQTKIALSDYYTDETHSEEMEVGVYYKVPFNANDQYLAWDMATGKPSETQAPEVLDKKVAYFWIVMKNSDGTIQKLTKQDFISDHADYARTSGNNTFTGDNTFEKDIVSNATQNVDSLNDKNLTTAKFVRDLINKKVNEAGHLTAKYYATAPEDGSLVVNELAVFPAKDNLSS